MSSQITPVKLNESNYFLWERAAYLYLGATQKLKYINNDPPVPLPEEWNSENSLVMLWLCHCIEPHIFRRVMCHKTAKKIWEALKEIYFHNEKCFRVYELYEKLLSLRRGDMSVLEYSRCLRRIWLEFNVYRPLTENLEELKQQRQEFEVAKFLHGASPKYRFIRVETIFSAKMPPLIDVLSRMLSAESLLALSTRERNGCQEEQSNEGNHGLQIIPMKLNEDNYVYWERSAYYSIGAADMLKYIYTDPPVPLPKEWESENYLVMAWLLNSMEPDISTQVMHHDSAKNIWEALREIYIRNDNCFRVYELYEKLFPLQQGHMSVLEYSNQFTQIWNELTVYRPLATNLEELKQQREEILVAKFLHGLGPEYEFVRSEIISSAKMLPLVDVLPRILRAEKFLTSSTQSRSKKNCYQEEKSITRGTRKCVHCGRKNHTSDACWHKIG